MPIIEYMPQHFEDLRKFVGRVGMMLSLTHRPFVDHYYASSRYCQLYLLLADDGSIRATLGFERMRFESKGQELIIGAGSNFYSLSPGVGGILFVQWLKACPVGLVYGGSPDTHRMIRGRRWTFYEGVRQFILGNPYEPYPGESRWRLGVKSVLRRTSRVRLSRYASRIPGEIRKKISVREEQGYTTDLLPREAPFEFRFAPGVDYLNWRYNPTLSFVKYRIFRILDGRDTVGYAVINDSPDGLTVAHCDGTDARIIAYGVLLSLLHVGREDSSPRSVWLSSSHPAMQEIYRRFGFRPMRSERVFAMGNLFGPADIEPDTSNWLVNLDWGDNRLRPPFLDQGPTPTRSA
ncbi:MAG: hypothetical protein WB869_01405 [Candidatus Acidiferrales bacterium]